MRASLIVHGGAWDIPADLIDAHKAGCRAALLAGWDILASGGSALDAVEAAIRLMEDDATFDAGRGSVLNVEGEMELDASIMEGSDLNAGAVAAVRDVKNPISLARRVLEESEHVFLVGKGASLFARRVGIGECDWQELLVERELERWESLRKEVGLDRQDAYRGPASDTVGAVALDRRGTIVAGNSTGGSPFKHAGRVGDSPLIGCGIYADNSLAGAACTGWGEGIIRVALAHSAVILLREGVAVQEAAAQAVQLLGDKVEGRGGIIMVDRNGDVGHAYSTPAMAHAYLTDDLDEPVVAV